MLPSNLMLPSFVILLNQVAHEHLSWLLGADISLSSSIVPAAHILFKAPHHLVVGIMNTQFKP